MSLQNSPRWESPQGGALSPTQPGPVLVLQLPPEPEEEKDENMARHIKQLEDQFKEMQTKISTELKGFDRAKQAGNERQLRSRLKSIKELFPVAEQRKHESIHLKATAAEKEAAEEELFIWTDQVEPLIYAAEQHVLGLDVQVAPTVTEAQAKVNLANAKLELSVPRIKDQLA